MKEIYDRRADLNALPFLSFGLLFIQEVDYKLAVIVHATALLRVWLNC